MRDNKFLPTFFNNKEQSFDMKQKKSHKISREMIMCILMLAAFLAFAGCNKEKKTTPSVIATVDGKTITAPEFDAYLKFKRMPAKDKKKREKVLDQYLNREAMAVAVAKEPLMDKDLIAAEQNEFRKEMLISRYFEAFLRDRVTDQAVKNYYNTHSADYEDKLAHVAHILIRTNKKMSEKERAAKLTTAQDAYSKIKAGGDFAKVAQTLSEDKVSSKKGGDLGWIKEGSISPVFSKHVFELKPGDVSEPFETPFGFHVVKLIDAPKVVRRPFNTVAGKIRYMLRNQAREAEMKRLMKEVKIEKIAVK